MLPRRPKTVGRLSEVFLSAYLATLGRSSSLNFPIKKSYFVVLVDGLGVANIKSAAAYARNLNHKLSSSKSIYSGFPSTTASSLASFATGKDNGEHGFLGYRVFDRELDRPINLLNDLGGSLDPRVYQDQETVSELAIREGLKVNVIGPAEYESSGFTQATMPGAKYLSAKNIGARFETALEVARGGASLTYLYVPELDQLAHRFGTSSNIWLEKLEELDSEITEFARLLPKTAGLVVTADHGVIDVPRSDHIYLDEFASLDDLLMMGGDPRVGFLYFPADCDLEQKRVQIEEQLGPSCYVTDVAELVEAGWIAPLGAAAKKLEPDFFLIPKGNKVLYHRKFAKSKSLEMIGQHGGWSKQEWEIPLLVY